MLGAWRGCAHAASSESDVPRTRSTGARIADGVSPIINATWLRYFPEHWRWLGQALEHHHLGQGPKAVPLPTPVHEDFHAILHPD